MKLKRKQKVLDLKPTQFAVGMLEVDEKISLVRKLNKKQREAYVNENPVPVIRSPHGDLYVVDHHHFLCVCYHVGIKKVRTKLIKDMIKSRMSYVQFWKWMFSTRNAYPFCQFGEGPRKALYLPKDIRGLADDPYRSLAWFVRKAGAFENSNRNFAEFQWANYFRKRGLLDRNGLKDMPHALVRAVKLAQAPAAKHLPGFGELNLKDENKAVQKAKKSGKEIERKDLRKEKF